jgi:hypothetical protein
VGFLNEFVGINGNSLRPYIYSHPRRKCMIFNDPIFWSFIVTMCSIALLTEAALLFHVLFVTRQRLWRYPLVIIPVAVSIWSYAVAFDTSNKSEYLSLVIHLQLIFGRNHGLKEIAAHLDLVCQHQAVITISVFATMLIIRRMTLPITVQPPVWTHAKNRLFSTNV